MKLKQQFQKKLFMSSVHNNEEGIVLIITLALLAIIALVATVVVNTTSTDIKISSNYKRSIQAFNEAEAGTEEARARIRANAGADRIQDDTPTDYSGDADWVAYIGTLTSAVSLGYDSGNPKHSIQASIQTDLDYTVVVAHKVDGANNVLYWGDQPPLDGILAENTTTGENYLCCYKLWFRS